MKNEIKTSFSLQIILLSIFISSCKGQSKIQEVSELKLGFTKYSQLDLSQIDGHQEIVDYLVSKDLQ